MPVLSDESDPYRNFLKQKRSIKCPQTPFKRVRKHFQNHSFPSELIADTSINLTKAKKREKNLCLGNPMDPSLLA